MLCFWPMIPGEGALAEAYFGSSACQWCSVQFGLIFLEACFSFCPTTQYCLREINSPFIILHPQFRVRNSLPWKLSERPGSSFVLVYTLEFLHVKSRKPGVFFSLFFFPGTLHHAALSLAGIYSSISLLLSESTNCLYKLSPNCRECVKLSQNNLGIFPTNFRW